MVVVVLVVEVEDVFDELLDVLELEDEDPPPLEQGFHTVTVQPALEEPLLEEEVVVDEPVVPPVVLELDEEALAGRIQSGPVLPFALHEALSLIMSRYSAALAMLIANRHRHAPTVACNVIRVFSLIDFILKPPCKMNTEMIARDHLDPSLKLSALLTPVREFL